MKTSRYIPKLNELQAIFAQEAEKYNVYPLDTRFAERADVSLRPSLTEGRTTFTYYPGDPGPVRIPEGATPDVKNRDFTITAEIEIPITAVALKGAGGVPHGVLATGVLATQGGRFGGWGLLLNKDGQPEFDYAYSNQDQHKYRVRPKENLAPEKLAPGKPHTIKFDFKYNGNGKDPGLGGTGTLSVDGDEVAKGPIEHTIPTRFSLDETFDIGMDTGTPVVEDYADKMPFQFTGTLKKVVIELGKPGITANAEKKLKEQAEKAVASC